MDFRESSIAHSADQPLADKIIMIGIRGIRAGTAIDTELSSLGGQVVCPKRGQILPGMTQRGYGRIVCMASDSARLGQARLSYYAAAKAGVVALVKSVAQEVGSSGVTLNVVSPGATNTELRQEREKSMREQMGEEKYARRVQTVLKMYPTRRIGERRG